MTQANCYVCNDVATDYLTCNSCETTAHPDCYNFVGSCGTYACDGELERSGLEKLVNEIHVKPRVIKPSIFESIFGYISTLFSKLYTYAKNSLDLIPYERIYQLVYEGSD